MVQGYHHSYRDQEERCRGVRLSYSNSDTEASVAELEPHFCGNTHQARIPQLARIVWRTFFSIGTSRVILSVMNVKNPALILSLTAASGLFLSSPVAAEEYGPELVLPEVGMPVEPPYYSTVYHPPVEPKEGQLQIGVTYTLWIPEGLKTVRGIIVHQHGCGDGSCKGSVTAAYDLHWQELAKKNNCALLGPSFHQLKEQNCRFWCDPRNGSDEVFVRSLEKLAEKSGHP